MTTNSENDEKLCWACKKTLVGESKLGLCPGCINKYGSPAAAVLGIVGIGGISFLGRKVLANSRKVAKVAIDVIKLITS